MTPPKEADSAADGGKAAPRRPSPPLWRLAFDAIERPIGAASESWVQTDVFMDALSLTWKVQRRMASQMHRGLGLWFGLFDMPRRSDVNALVTQVASLERQVRQMARELERRDADSGEMPGPRQRPAATTRKVSANGGRR
jgi:hypothetical protein